MSGPTAFVVGWPVAHSRSPLIHRFWLNRYRLPGDYVRQAVPPDEFERFLAGLADRGFVGGNVTVPYKEAAFRRCVEVTAVAERLGAVNTLWLEGDRLLGDNTDAHGFACNLDDANPDWRSGLVAAVLGAGGAARAVLHAVAQAGYREIILLNRTAERASDVARRFGMPVQAGPLTELPYWLPRCDLVVNTTSAELSGHDALPVDWRVARRDAIAADIVYVPLLTPFLQGAADRGLRIADGLGMLLHQAAPGFERWFGRRPAVDAELRDAVLVDLEP